MKIRPIGERVIIQLSEKTTESGLVLPGNELDEVATIISVGDEVFNFKKGDKVIFNKFAGYALENEKQRLIETKDIYAIVE